MLGVVEVAVARGAGVAGVAGVAGAVCGRDTEGDELTDFRIIGGG